MKCKQQPYLEVLKAVNNSLHWVVCSPIYLHLRQFMIYKIWNLRSPIKT